MITDLGAYCSTIPDAYHQALYHLYSAGVTIPCPDWDTEQLACGMKIKVYNPLKEPMISKCGIFSPADLQQYVMEMTDGILDFRIGNGWDYTYHDRMGKQLDFVIEELKRNPYSRRAVIDVRTPEDIGSNDPACLQHMQFFCDEYGNLCLTVLFRSNDAVKACFMNMFALVMVQKKVADALGRKVGCYVHNVNNFHCYKKDLPLLEGYLDRLKYSSKGDMAYNYVGEWKEYMDESIPGIMAKVEKLKQGVIE